MSLVLPGMAGYLKTLSAEVAADGVTVNLLLPGRVATDRLASLDAAAAERTGRSLAAGRRGSAPWARSCAASSPATSPVSRCAATAGSS